MKSIMARHISIEKLSWRTSEGVTEQFILMDDDFQYSTNEPKSQRNRHNFPHFAEKRRGHRNFLPANAGHFHSICGHKTVVH